MRRSSCPGSGGFSWATRSTSPRRILVVVGRPQRQQFVQRGAQTVDVAARVGDAAEALRGHVAERADQVAGLRQFVVVALLARPKSVTQTVPALSQEQVGRLERRGGRRRAGARSEGLGHLHADPGHAPEILGFRARG